MRIQQHDDAATTRHVPSPMSSARGTPPHNTASPPRLSVPQSPRPLPQMITTTTSHNNHIQHHHPRATSISMKQMEDMKLEKKRERNRVAARKCRYVCLCYLSIRSVFHFPYFHTASEKWIAFPSCRPKWIS